MNPTDTLADLVNRYPAAARVLHKHRLDFCCGGQRPFTDACEERGIDSSAVLEEILATRPAKDAHPAGLETMPIPQLIDTIVNHYHRRLREVLPEILALSKKIEVVHGEKDSYPNALHGHLEEIAAAIDSHLAKEEGILFPMLREGGTAVASGPIQVMMLEHEDHGNNLRRLRAMTDDLTPPSDSCESWRALYQMLEALEIELMEHIHLENNVLFPRSAAWNG